MKITEIVNTNRELEEGWKERLAAAGLAAGVGLVGWNVADKFQTKPEIPAEISQMDVKPAPKSASGAQSGPGYRRMLIAYATRAGITGDELSQLLAQSGHETGGFRKMTETGDAAYFRKYDPEFNPRMAKILGNTEAGDGRRYCGRGGLQLTGRYNYTEANKFLAKNRDLVGNVDIVKNPGLVASDPMVNVLVTIWYWRTRVRAHKGEFSDTSGVTKHINAGLSGLGDRSMRFEVEREKHRSLGLHADDTEADILYRSRLDAKKPLGGARKVGGSQKPATTAAARTQAPSLKKPPSPNTKKPGSPPGRGKK